MSTESSFKLMNQDFVKLDKFDGTNFSRWQEKARFMLDYLNLSYVLDPTLPQIPEDPVIEEGQQPTAEQQQLLQQLAEQRKIRAKDTGLCRGHILNMVSDRIFDLYTSVKDPRELWEALDFKYKAEEQGINKYLIDQYLEFKMVDNKSIMDQIHELQVIVNKLSILKIVLPEIFQVGVIISKLPHSWNGFAKKLMHKSEDFTMEEIQKTLRIEEEARKRMSKNFNHEGVNFVKGGPSKKPNKSHANTSSKRKFVPSNNSGGGQKICRRKWRTEIRC